MNELSHEQLEYARHREILNEPMPVAAYHVGMSQRDAKAFETSPAYQTATEAVQSVSDTRSLTLAARKHLSRVVKGQADDVPAQARTHTARWVLEKTDDDLADPEQKAARQTEEDELDKELDAKSEDELREIAESESRDVKLGT